MFWRIPTKVIIFVIKMYLQGNREIRRRKFPLGRNIKKKRDIIFIQTRQECLTV